MLKILIISFFIISSQVSCQVRAENMQMIQKGIDNLSVEYLTFKEKNTLSNGNVSLLYSFGKDHSCRVEFNKAEEIVDSECNIDTVEKSEERLRKLYERIKEDMSIVGYCSIKIKDKKLSEPVLNRCLYAEYILISSCSEKNNCLDYKEWYINKNHNK
jgi:hypothetical protein